MIKMVYGIQLPEQITKLRCGQHSISTEGEAFSQCGWSSEEIGLRWTTGYCQVFLIKWLERCLNFSDLDERTWLRSFITSWLEDSYPKLI